MRTSRFSEAQIIAILKEADADVSVKDLARKHGISLATFYNWKAKYGGADAEACLLKQIKELRLQIEQYKSMYAELARENFELRGRLERKS
jgi:putative transposase